MTESLLERSARIIDAGLSNPPLPEINPIDGSFHEIADDIALVCGFSHVWSLRGGDGLAVFDTTRGPGAPAAVDSIRRWSDAPFESLVYTHGHIDHVGGAVAFLADAQTRRNPRPRVVAHENVQPRFDRYHLTNGYNEAVNLRQFGPAGRGFPDSFVEPDTTFEQIHRFRIGDTSIELHHDKGETDDHAWAWLPDHEAILSGDLFTWVFPNAGNPQKVQRYPAEWAAAHRKMAAMEPALLLPAHGLPIAGKQRIAQVLHASASVLEGLVADTVAMMNAGATLDDIIHTVTVPAEYAELPYMAAIYDEPEFVVRNIWRLYGGWYDGNPARLKPAADATIAAEVALLAGGPDRLATRARDLADAGDLRLACQLAEWAVQAAPDDADAQMVRADVYRARRKSETSLMAKGIFGTAAKTPPVERSGP